MILQVPVVVAAATVLLPAVARCDLEEEPARAEEADEQRSLTPVQVLVEVPPSCDVRVQCARRASSKARHLVPT